MTTFVSGLGEIEIEGFFIFLKFNIGPEENNIMRKWLQIMPLVLKKCVACFTLGGRSKIKL